MQLCIFCSESYKPTRVNQKFCSQECYSKSKFWTVDLIKALGTCLFSLVV